MSDPGSNREPQRSGHRLLTDGGIETWLIFDRGIDLPLFAAFGLLGNESGERILRDYYEPYLELAAERGTGFVLASPTWRTSARWGEELGYDSGQIAAFNRRGIEFLSELRDEYADRVAGPIVLSGCIGPQGDGYQPEELLTEEEAERYHSTQIATFAETAAESISALTMTHVEEALGITRAAAASDLPAVISFTLETDGRLPSGQSLGEAIEEVDAEPVPPAYFMVNCAHPTHFEGVLDPTEPWTSRVRAIRCNASTRSHAELDEAEELDRGDPADLGRRYRELADSLPSLNVFGGCCGTDIGHVAAIAAALD